SITAGSPTGARVELGAFGLRKYADDGTTIDVDLSGGQAVFSGIVAGSDIIGGRLRTAVSGARVEIDANENASQIRLFTPFDPSVMGPATLDHWIYEPPESEPLAWLLL